jgi:hypothetical protein
MSKFTKIPIEIEAERITEKIEIVTREGTLYGYPGEWLLTGIEGEKYPCGDAIFRKTYYPSGKDKCTYCEHDGEYPRYCDSYEVCTFKWKEPLTDITVGNFGGNR